MPAAPRSLLPSCPKIQTRCQALDGYAFHEDELGDGPGAGLRVRLYFWTRRPRLLLAFRMKRSGGTSGRFIFLTLSYRSSGGWERRGDRGTPPLPHTGESAARGLVIPSQKIPFASISDGARRLEVVGP